MTHAEALAAAFCVGWIDGQVKKHDEDSWLHKFAPRRPRSIWSKRNREIAEKLAAAGKMKPAGLKEVEAAKADGRWDRAYDSPSTMTVPKDFTEFRHPRSPRYPDPGGEFRHPASSDTREFRHPGSREEYFGAR